MRPKGRWLVMVVAVGAALVASAPAAGDERMERRREEYFARQMQSWMRFHGREPTEEDLSKSSYLRKLWSAYRRVTGRQTRDRREEERRRGEWVRREVERRASREHQKALDLLARKRYWEAVEAFQDILNNDDYSMYHEDARAKLQDMDQIGQDEVRQAQQLAAAQKYEEAFNRYLSVVQRFRGLPCARTAATEYTALKNSPALQAKLKKERAVNLLKRADSALASKDYGDAASLYEMLVQSYADIDEGRTAKAKLDEMKANEAIWAAVVKQRAEAEAESLLALANAYITAGMSDKGASRLQELIQKYPDTEHAKKAKELLATLQAPKPAS
jgi:TolA-binding protein